MGLLDKLRGELVDIIEWLDHTRDTLVWRFPRYHNQIKSGAQLIVRPGQMAVFVHRGKLADVFQPGNYELKTDNLPLLATLQGWKHGFDSPFKSEVYFVSTRLVTDLKWGTPNPIMLRDPEFGPIRLRAFGTYTLQATDPTALLEELVGTDSAFEADEVHEFIRSMINTALADLLGNSGISALDLAAKYEELSEQLRQSVVERIDDEYGLNVPQLFIINISLPEEVEKALDTRTSMSVIGNMGQFQQYQMGKAMTEAASNPAGGGASDGMGLGMGFAMANQMMQQMPQTGRTGPGAAGMPPVAPVSWYLAVNGQTQGPITPAQLTEAIAGGQIHSGTMLWTSGMSGWLPAGQVPQLAGHFGSGPPTPPPPPK
jgi:membrane protease subunit (stomatin/prohibitin family)